MYLLSRPPGLTSRCQAGAISIMAAAGLAALVASALLAVDLGSLFYTKRQLQNVADNAALSAVNDLANASLIATDTASKNDFTLPGEHGNTLETVTGRYDTATPEGIYQGSFSAGGDPALQDAVRVTVTTQQPYFFLLGSHEVAATATATRTPPVAGFSIGSGLVSLDTSRSALLNAILGGLLHTSLNLDAVSYQGLATAHVSLLDLVKADANVGTVDELLAADLSLAEVLHLSAQALGQDDILYADLENLANLQATGDLHLRLGDLIRLSVADGAAAANAQINVLQLITMAAEVANGQHFLDVPMLGINLGIATLDLSLSLIEPPSIAIGPAGKDASGNWLTQAHTAQARLKLDLKVLDVLGPLLGIHVPLYIEVARGDAWLESIECRTPRDDSSVVIGATSGIASVYIGEVNADAMTNTETAATVQTATLLNVLGLIKAEAKVAVNLPGGAGDLEFNGPFDANNTQRISGLSTVGLADSLVNKMGSGDPQTVLKVTLLGIPLNLSAILDLLLPVLEPVLGLLDSLLAPVLSLLGLQLGYADVTNFHLNCGVPRLVR